MNGERSVKSELAILTAPEMCVKIPFCPLTPVFLICFLSSILAHSLVAFRILFCCFYSGVLLPQIYCYAAL